MNPTFSTTTYWYHPDHLGSASWVSDKAGKGIQHLYYLPWGEELDNQRATDYASRYTFSGKERDVETGYGYFGARYYNSDLSIWLSVDPMADKYPSMSPYTYCANNPVRLVDPDGREWEIGNEKYNPGQSYNGKDKEVAAIWNKMEKIYATALGKKVIDALNIKGVTYHISTGKCPTSDNPCFYPPDKTIYLNTEHQIWDETTIAHEMFHAYQCFRDQCGKTIHNEVEAYMFEVLVCNESVAGQLSMRPGMDNKEYFDATLAFSNRQWKNSEDFNKIFGTITNGFRKFSYANLSGQYEEKKGYTMGKNQDNLLEELLFKQK